eukprot:2934591-Ditylum_brightwellii.AAC.1
MPGRKGSMKQMLPKNFFAVKSRVLLLSTAYRVVAAQRDKASRFATSSGLSFILSCQQHD